MSIDKIEIVLTHINEANVDLDNMSKDALISFMSVIESFRNISEDILSSEVSFSIKKGSACFGVYSSPNNIKQMVGLMNEAIGGNSFNQIMTDNMRRIQKEIQDPNLSYKLLYKDQNLAPRIKTAKKITKKRISKVFDYKLEILTGFFNQLGGTEPNYHFDRGKNEDKITIECTIEDAKELKNCLFEDISTVVIRKKERNEEKPVYIHCAILQSKNQTRSLHKFLKEYNAKENIIDRLDCIYEYIDNSNAKIEDILLLLKIFRNRIFDINEIKTVLVISKNIKTENNCIEFHRNKLLSLFNNLLDK